VAHIGKTVHHSVVQKKILSNNFPCPGLLKEPKTLHLISKTGNLMLKQSNVWQKKHEQVKKKKKAMKY
jgi:hypothetical protein